MTLPCLINSHRKRTRVKKIFFRKQGECSHSKINTESSSNHENGKIQIQVKLLDDI